MPLQAEAVAGMTQALCRLENLVSPPQMEPLKDSFVYRYPNKGIREAIIQKLARYISGLNAILVLLRAGYVQEIGVLFRTLDEIQEDIMFLATAETNHGRTARHEKYLAAFYSDSVCSRQEGSLDIPKPDLVPRKKIRAHTMDVLGKGVNVSQSLAASEAIGTAYSGYVHANSESIMDMYGGRPPRFNVTGMLGTPRIAPYARDAGNYIYRGLMATITAAKAFGDAELVKDLYAFLAKYETVNGHAPPSAKSES